MFSMEPPMADGTSRKRKSSPDGGSKQQDSPKKARRSSTSAVAVPNGLRTDRDKILRRVISDNQDYASARRKADAVATLPSPPPAASFFSGTETPPLGRLPDKPKRPSFLQRFSSVDSETEDPPTRLSLTGSLLGDNDDSDRSLANSPESDEFPMGDIEQVNAVYKKAAGIAFVAWIVLILGTYTVYHSCHSNHDFTPNYDDTVERHVAQTAFFILLVSQALQILPLLLERLGNPTSTEVSGILVAAMAIGTISLFTNALLGWGPRAVVTDPITGSRVFLVRWCEWTPLAGLITLLAESSDVSSRPGAWKKPILFSLCQAISTFCGSVLPYCQSTTQWTMVMTISIVLFVSIVPRVQIRRRIFLSTPRGTTDLEREYYDRRKFAYIIMGLCSVVWSGLVCLYFMNLAIHMMAPTNHFLRFESLAMSCDTLFDVIAKVIYTRVIVDAHQAVFSSDLRTMRQLNELKQLMSMLWVSSSDVIVISTQQSKHRNATMLSPSFLTLVGANLPLKKSNPQDNDQMDSHGQCEVMPESAALVLETDRGKIVSACYVDTSTMSDLNPAQIHQQRVVLTDEDLQENAVVQALRITNTAWATRNYNSDAATNSSDSAQVPLRAMSIVHCDPSRTGKVLCEMKVSRHAEHTAVAVVRDVTERYRRFEAESRAHAETIARQRDMHTANRFTRHEVKNGLLSGIELCRTLGQSLDELKSKLVSNGKLAETSIKDVVPVNVDEKAFTSLVDLDGTLRGVLDTVLAEVMAREVVHEVYQPRLEELDVPSMLVSNLGMSKDRIPVTVRGVCMPKLLLDAQLIGHIHRNAVSNAIKYGKQGGLVQTFLEFDTSKQDFRMEVTNEPGTGHDALLTLGESASEFVFAQGVRLQPHMKGKTEKKLDSSGDGAWIMQKCAKTMNGGCNIYFNNDGTRFSFHCPAVPVEKSTQPNYSEFVVPGNVWGVGLDDSKIQRKLLSRILAHTGVHSSRQVVLGETHEEVTDFESTLMNLMDEHPGQKFLVIVDEHLDYDNLALKQHNGVHSGSILMKQVLAHMSKEHLARVLVLMRSANDSAVDIAMYTQRTHGYFPKAIMQRDRTREILAPLWLCRFPEDAPES